jgi:hypothetical protein
VRGLPAVSSSSFSTNFLVSLFLFSLWLRVKRSLGPCLRWTSLKNKPRAPLRDFLVCVLTKEFERDFLASRERKEKNNNFLKKGGRRHAVCHSRVVPLLPRPLFPCCTIIFRLILSRLLRLVLLSLWPPLDGPIGRSSFYLSLSLLWWCEMVIIASPYRLLDIFTLFLYIYISRASFLDWHHFVWSKHFLYIFTRKDILIILAFWLLLVEGTVGNPVWKRLFEIPFRHGIPDVKTWREWTSSVSSRYSSPFFSFSWGPKKRTK